MVGYPKYWNEEKETLTSEKLKIFQEEALLRQWKFVWERKWIKVRLGNGQEGWIRSEVLE